MGKTFFKSPLGQLEITTDEGFIKAIQFVENEGKPEDWDLVGAEAVAQLKAYFNKTLTHFDLPLSPEGTAFQKKVWQLLQEIPFGKTMSYQDLSIQYGDVKAIRAVGSANGKNPIPIVIPCHRVIGNKGDLVGYSGGLDKKRWLLDFESNQLGLF